MEAEKVRQLAKELAEQRIALLAEIVKTGDATSASLAATRIAMIGTAPAVQTLADLAKETTGALRITVESVITLLPALQRQSPTELAQIMSGDAEYEVGFADIQVADPRLRDMRPLWELLIKAFEHNTKHAS